MEAFIEKFSRKYNLPAADCLRLIGLMERRVFRKGECVVRQPVSYTHLTLPTNSLV